MPNCSSIDSVYELLKLNWLPVERVATSADLRPACCCSKSTNDCNKLLLRRFALIEDGFVEKSAEQIDSTSDSSNTKTICLFFL